MKFKSICLLVIAMFFLTNHETFAQKKSDTGIGKVDLYVLLLLHPDMINYNTEMKAFTTKRDENSKKKAKAEEENNNKSIQELYSQMGEIKAKMKEEEQKYSKELDKINKKHIEELVDLATGPAELKKATFKQRLDRLEALHYSTMTLFAGQYSLVEDKLMKIKEFGFNENFTTPEETQKRFNAIIKETEEYIKKIAKQKGISIVFNSNYKRLMQNSIAISSKNKKTITMDNSLNAIFNTAFPQELLSDKLAVEGYYGSVTRKTVTWLNEAGSILGRMKSSLVNSDIIIGGTDLTKDVLEALYKAYKLDPNISTAVIQSAIMY